MDKDAETLMAEEMLGDNYEPKVGKLEMSELLRVMIAKSPESEFKVKGQCLANW